MDTDFLDWALADFSGYVAADEVYDGPFCILSAVDNRLSLSRLNVKCRQNLEIRYYGANVVTSCFLECQKPGELKSR